MGGGVSKWKWQDTKSIFGKARNSWDSDLDSDLDSDSYSYSDSYSDSDSDF